MDKAEQELPAHLIGDSMLVLNEMVPPGVLPNRAALDAYQTLSWIAWREVSWPPVETPVPASALAEREAGFARAHCQLVNALASGDVHAWACKPARYTPPSTLGFQIRPDGEAQLLQASLFFTPGIHIHSHGYVTLDYDPSHSTAELPVYLSIRFLTSDVGRLWPAPLPDTPAQAQLQPEAAPQPAPAPIYNTGAAGRPTSRHLVGEEMRRRATAGQLQPTIAAEANVLADWLLKAHPSAPPMTKKAIENALRAEYWELRKTPK